MVAAVLALLASFSWGTSDFLAGLEVPSLDRVDGRARWPGGRGARAHRPAPRRGAGAARTRPPRGAGRRRRDRRTRRRPGVPGARPRRHERGLAVHRGRRSRARALGNGDRRAARVPCRCWASSCAWWGWSCISRRRRDQAAGRAPSTARGILMAVGFRGRARPVPGRPGPRRQSRPALHGHRGAHHGRAHAAGRRRGRPAGDPPPAASDPRPARRRPAHRRREPPLHLGDHLRLISASSASSGGSTPPSPWSGRASC